MKYYSSYTIKCFQFSFYSTMLFYYTCCIFPFNYLLPDDSVQLYETHYVINYINKNLFC